MEYKLGYDQTHMKVNIDDKNLLRVLKANEVELDLVGGAEVKRALENPIGSPRLRDIVEKGEKIAIITSDITRPMPSKAVLPYILEELESIGVEDKDIIIVFALGRRL